MAASAFRIRDLEVHLGERRVLNIPTLDLEGPAIVSIVGPNGCGKSTLLRALAFLQAPSHGSISLEGATTDGTVADQTGNRSSVTMVAQSPFLFRRSVRANVAYGMPPQPREMANERIEAALAAVGMRDFADRPAAKLSGGEGHRVAIARALVLDRPVYLFDEPTAAVDRQHVPLLEKVLVQLATAGKLVVMTTHRLEQAYRLSHRIITLMAGAIVPSTSLNLLTGHIQVEEEATWFIAGPVQIEIPTGSSASAISISPDDILVSRHRLDSSARNSIPGHIRKVEHDDRGFLLAIDCGTELLARVTPHSYRELALNVGAEVFVTFKASTVQLHDVASFDPNA